jgi:poly-D-alanine transfer protein DltD
MRKQISVVLVLVALAVVFIVCFTGSKVQERLEPESTKWNKTPMAQTGIRGRGYQQRIIAVGKMRSAKTTISHQSAPEESLSQPEPAL